jgi:MipA family protein
MRRSITVALVLMASLAAQAQPEAPAPAPIETAGRPAPLPLWELGAVFFGVYQQVYLGSDQNLTRALPLPFLIYRGDVLRADQERLGVRAVNTPTVEVDIDFAGAFGSSSDDIDARRGMPDLGTRIELGPRVKWNLGAAPGGGRWQAEFPLRAVFDVDDRLSTLGLSFEPGLQYSRRSSSGWAYSAGVSALVGNRRRNEVYYTVDPAFATPERPAYDASAGLVAWRASLSLSRKLTPDWQLFGFVRMNTLAGSAVEDSPLVRRTTGASAGLGVAWTWKRSEQPGAD